MTDTNRVRTRSFRTLHDATFGPRYTTPVERVRLRIRHAFRRLKVLANRALDELKTDDAGDFGI